MAFRRRNLRWQVADPIVGPHPWPCLYIAFGTRSEWCETVASPKPLGRPWVDGWLEWQEPLDISWTAWSCWPRANGLAKRWIPNARNDISSDHHLQRSGGVLRCLWCWYFLTTRCWDHEDPRRPGSLWTQAMKDAVTPKPSFDANDGEFWMCYRDFLKLGTSKMFKVWKVTLSQSPKFHCQLGKNWIHLISSREIEVPIGSLSFHIISNISTIAMDSAWALSARPQKNVWGWEDGPFQHEFRCEHCSFPTPSNII